MTRLGIAHAAGHPGLISAHRRLSGGRLPASDVATAEPPTTPGHGDRTTGGRPPAQPDAREVDVSYTRFRPSRRRRALMAIPIAALLLAAHIGWTLVRLPDQPQRTAPEREIGALVSSPMRGR